MRKVTETIVHAFMDGQARCVGNSHTDGESLFLHGNRIAWKGEHNGVPCVFLTLAGWPTPTTRARLQGVLSVMGHRSPHLAPDRPCLNIGQHDHLQRITSHTTAGDDGPDNDSRIISDTDVLAVFHPRDAMGLRAVVVV